MLEYLGAVWNPGTNSEIEYYLQIGEDGLPPCLVALERGTRRFISCRNAQVELAYNERAGLRPEVTARGREVLAQYRLDRGRARAEGVPDLAGIDDAR
jgi:hypothetical protein